jgi:carbonic anhydrase/acetyltransferase-like protein (isoleucine patch superfamily)
MPIFSLGDRRLTSTSDEFFIAPTVTLVGSVHMGRASSIWFDCVVRADGERVVLGDRCNIQDACVLHADLSSPVLLGDDVSVGHKVMLHGCRVGAGTLIGMNAVLLNGCSVGAGSIVAAHSLLPEGRHFPDGVLIMGAPAKVVRPLAEDEKAYLLGIAASYAERAARYKQELKLEINPTIAG